MKKTIIAMLALSGVAFGATADELNTNLNGYIEYSNYTAGDNFVLSYTLNLGTNITNGQNIFGVADNWHLYCYNRSYLGITDSGDPGSWNLVEGGSATKSPYTNDLTYTSSDSDSNSKSWLVQTDPYTLDNPIGEVTITLISRTLEYIIAGQTVVGKEAIIKVTKDGKDWISSDIVDAAGNVAQLDLSKVNFLLDSAGATTVEINGQTHDLTQAVPTPAIPEPTTATLSLLALAGLAARRRRK